MKTIIVFAVLLLSVSLLYADNQQMTTAPSQKENPIAIVKKISPEQERRGCCSWHGGVCGCKGGRALCCDGTLSPSCGCD